jgi:hypothetical protein
MIPHSSCWIRIQLQKGKKLPTKIEKVKKNAGCCLLRTEGFSCSLGVLYEGLGISKLQFLIKKIKKNFS